MVLCQLVLVPLLPPQYHHQKLVVTRLVCGSGVEGWWVRDGRAPRRNAASLANTEKKNTPPHTHHKNHPPLSTTTPLTSSPSPVAAGWRGGLGRVAGARRGAGRGVRHGGELGARA